MVLSQVQATTTGQPIKVPQFVPPPRLTPRPTFQPQVRHWKPRLQTVTPPPLQPCPAFPLPPSLLPFSRPVCSPREVICSLTSRGQECAKANTHALLVALKHCLLCAAPTHLSRSFSSLCFLYFLTDLWAGCFSRSPACLRVSVCVRLSGLCATVVTLFFCSFLVFCFFGCWCFFCCCCFKSF